MLDFSVLLLVMLEKMSYNDLRNNLTGIDGSKKITVLRNVVCDTDAERARE